jgi:uncharacterized membrane protein (DUF485 family)
VFLQFIPLARERCYITYISVVALVAFKKDKHTMWFPGVQSGACFAIGNILYSMSLN